MVVAFGIEGSRFESSYRKSFFPLGSPLLAATAFLKSDARCHFNNIKEVKDKRVLGQLCMPEISPSLWVRIITACLHSFRKKEILRQRQKRRQQKRQKPI